MTNSHQIRLRQLGAAAAIVLIAGCGSSEVANTSGSTASGAKVADSAPKAEFCTLYAKTAARKIADMSSFESMMGGDAAAAQSLQGEVDELIKDAPVEQGQLVAAAPAEPKKYLEAMADFGSTQDADALMTNMKSLNEWAIANCDPKFRDLFIKNGEYVG